ncbi:hypothetical protein M9H77_20342 [Catharanthus roseus]|uniref:Uncharacterized protein n=1 Tax=Catharanthus roseus TaxID=4058 RepID=A0ACC0ALI5_CATRO|nr:hypothetical protein M9H77_20342 [Catharanthus roseus]
MNIEETKKLHVSPKVEALVHCVSSTGLHNWEQRRNTNIKGSSMKAILVQWYNRENFPRRYKDTTTLPNQQYYIRKKLYNCYLIFHLGGTVKEKSEVESFFLVYLYSSSFPYHHRRGCLVLGKDHQQVRAAQRMHAGA